jgi:hypothetical protein
MIFAQRYLAENRSFFTMILIGLPVLLAPALLIAGALAGWEGLALAVLALLAKAVALSWMRWRYAQRPPRIAEIILEPLADGLTPLHLLHAMVRPNRFQWRSRSINVEGGDIKYD